MPLSQSKNFPFGKFKKFIRPSRPLITSHGHLGGGLNKATKQGFIANNITVIPDIGGTGHHLYDFCNIRGTPDLVEFAGPSQIVCQGNLINRLIPFRQCHHATIHDPVARSIKVILRQDFHRSIKRRIIKKNGSKDGLFRFKILGRNSDLWGFRYCHG